MAAMITLPYLVRDIKVEEPGLGLLRVLRELQQLLKDLRSIDALSVHVDSDVTVFNVLEKLFRHLFA